MLKDYIFWNWSLILILMAFAISLEETVFLAKSTIRKIRLLIIEIFLLSIAVYAEFYLADHKQGSAVRSVLMAIRYSSTPFIIAQIIHAMTKKIRWAVYIPAIMLALIDLLSIFNGLVFSIDADGVFKRGPLGYLPFILVGIYCAFLIYILIRNSNKQLLEIIPIVFMAFAFISGLILPFIYGSDYSRLFVITIAIALFVYYVFTILLLTKKDPLTGLLNRQAYYADVDNNPEGITALISIDMNGLKPINDNSGHAAGDEALASIASCIMKALKKRQQGYRIGGDEFIVVCRQTSKEDTIKLAQEIRNKLSETTYSCSIGYGHIADGAKTIDELMQAADAMMYEDKARYYTTIGKDRRHRS